MDWWFRAEIVFLTPLSRPCPKPAQGGAGTPKIVVSLSKSTQQVTRTLTHLSSPFSLRNICRGFGGSRMAHAVSTRQPTRGQNNAHTPGIHLLHVGAGHSSPDPLPFPQAQPSHRTHHCEDISGCETAALSLHACTFTILFLLSMFLFVFCSESIFGQQQNTRDLDSCFSAMTG